VYHVISRGDVRDDVWTPTPVPDPGSSLGQVPIQDSLG
jgi:hypothetical protein